MWIAIVTRFSHTCDVTDVLSEVMIGVGEDILSDTISDVGVDLLSDMEITGIAVIIPKVILEFVVGVTDSEDVMTVVIIGVVPAIDVDMLAGENVRGLAAVMTPLEVTLSSPREESMPFC